MGLAAIRKEEGRDAWAAFLTLFALIASHSILETARDALFLAKVPAARLPWVFLAIAALSFAVVKLQDRIGKRLSPRKALSVFTMMAALVNFGFFAVLRQLGEAGVYALYVWSGLLTTFVLVHFWALVGDLFTITQAKRLYGFIGAGSVLGAIAGSGAAGLLAQVFHPHRLLLFSALGFVGAAFVPLAFRGSAQGQVDGASAPKLVHTLTYVAKDPYARRVAGTMFAATMCLTVSDFVFKSMAASMVPKAELGAFFGSMSFAANVLSLIAQFVVVGWLLKRLSLGAALAVLPALMMVGGLGIVITGTLGAVLAVKGTDGALRYSLHRTASELLFLPFGEEARRRVKAFIDVVGQRGGQVLASLAILGFSSVSASPRVIAIALVVLAALWIATAIALRRPYIALFRGRLRSGLVHHVDEFPELDVASLETLIGSLESDNDAEVMAALHVLEREKKAHLVPALILYHPSEQVVVRALGILTRAGRKNLVHMIDRVIDHPSPLVRAATIASRSVLVPDSQKLLMRLSFEESPEVRATIVVNLIASGEFSGSERDERVDAILKNGSVSTRVAFADAIARRHAKDFDAVLEKLVSAKEPEVRRAAVTAMGSVGGAALLPAIVRALGDESTHEEAERILGQLGDPAFVALLDALDEIESPAATRWRIPHALIMVNADRAAAALLGRLGTEPNGAVRYKIIRALEHVVRRRPSLTLDGALLSKAVATTLTRAYRDLDRRAILDRGARSEPRRKTPGHDLLHDLLRDKEANARERLFRLLGLLYPREDFGEIRRGLASGKLLRASSIELIENILSEPIRGAVLGLADDGPLEQRLAQAGRYHRALGLDYDALVSSLIEADSATVREVSAYHASELGIATATPRGRAA